MTNHLQIEMQAISSENEYADDMQLSQAILAMVDRSSVALRFLLQLVSYA